MRRVRGERGKGGGSEVREVGGRVRGERGKGGVGGRIRGERGKGGGGWEGQR